MGLVDNKVVLITSEAEEAANLVASDRTSYSTGAEFIVDGGIISI